ncbi:response regulator [Bacillus sp. FJAT-50079]|nr:response regulator [Bacillus sp. FJAT-50079]MBS4206976.1 response regulator [Bacillus sp. FJAT-50079]
MNSKNVLIVDDEQNTRRGIKRTLEGWAEEDVQILSAANGKEALSILEQEKVHLLITDIRMPEMSGLELLRMLKNKGMQAVVIIISSYSEFAYAQEAIRLGVVNYLVKPISKQKLIEAVQEAFIKGADLERAVVFEKVIDNQLVKIDQALEEMRDPIKEALTYINEHIKQQLNLSDVANYVHLNTSYFSVLFKEQMNMTFSEYITRRRLQNAKSLLINTNLSIEEISLRVGYQTSKYFNKLFKEYEGTTPSKYRKGD